MSRKVSVENFTNTLDPEFRTRMMRDVIKEVRKNGTLYMPLLNLVASFIDGLASGRPGKTKKAYIQYLKTHFPELCAELGAETFYSKYRNASIHEFSTKPGFVIGRKRGMGSEYVESIQVNEMDENLIVLNIDRLVDDFLSHIERLRSSLGISDQDKTT